MMRVGRSIVYIAIGAGLLLAYSGIPTTLAASADTGKKSVVSQIEALQELPRTVLEVEPPHLAEPQWLKKQNAAEVAARNGVHVPASSKVVTYDVTSRGAITADMAEFRALANTTLNDARGWSRLGVTFQEVASGGSFTLVLSTANQMTSFSSGCGTEYSCRAGRYVIINQNRWLGATTSWNQAGGSLRDYRHMVVNHETGHWLGHDHATCGGSGQPAPVMQQQSISLQGCRFSPWPAKSELWSTQLGIGKA